MLACCFHGQTFTSTASASSTGTGINFEGQQQRLYPSGLGRLSHLFVYPIKSCAAMAKKSWPLCPTFGSLLFDRHWMIVSCGGDSVTQKRCSALCSIVPEENECLEN
uniref:MOSC_N domain-containing protein n=1 Tax=Globodera pallida TaxID=36090 RepID=A0A183CPW3_GLOPA